MKSMLLKVLLVAVLLLNINYCLREDDNVNQAGQLLDELLRESRQALEELDKNWDETHPLIKSVLDQVYEEFLSLEQECKDKEAAISDTYQSIENSQHYIEWIDEKLNDNQKRIESYEDQYCSSSQLYINALKHQKIAMSLIEFIRNALQNTESLSLVQKQSVFKRLELFVQLYAQDKVQELDQLKSQVMFSQQEEDNSTAQNQEEQQDAEKVRQRTEEEIGTGHIDENRDQISVDQVQSGDRKDFGAYKEQLLALLDQLEQRLQDKLDQSQDQQIDAGVSLSEYKIQVGAEQAELRRHRQQEEEKISRFEAKTIRQKVGHKTCMDELNIVFNSLIETRAEYNEQVEAHDERRSSLQEEYELFQFVHNQYESTVEGKQSYADRAYDNFD